MLQSQRSMALLVAIAIRLVFPPQRWPIWSVLAGGCNGGAKAHAGQDSGCTDVGLSGTASDWVRTLRLGCGQCLLQAGGGSSLAAQRRGGLCLQAAGPASLHSETVFMKGHNLKILKSYLVEFPQPKAMPPIISTPSLPCACGHLIGE